MIMIKDLSKIKSLKTCFSFNSESTVSEIADMMDLKDIGAVPIFVQFLQRQDSMEVIYLLYVT